MIQINEDIWTGDFGDSEAVDFLGLGISAILNVAHDMDCKLGWKNGIEYAKCGLVDGPGTSMASYYAAVCKLVGLVKGGRRTLVVDHTNGGRVLFTVMAYLNLMDPKTWDEWRALIAERRNLPEGMPHAAHKIAFGKMNWELLKSVF